ncbi:hypothetical protein A7P53_07660 [Acinetobacter defluvii]|nr:hypothetical protein [Acinetobacter defluvii]NNP72339.1 hypothetical protein [Acinetobacter defluvii]
MFTSKHLLAISLSSILLTACGGGSSDSSSNPEPVKPTPKPTETQQGRLVIANADPVRPLLSVYDLNEHKNINTTALTVVPTTMYSSPAYRYAVLLGRTDHVVSFVDGGIFDKNTVLQKDNPHLLAYKLTGAAPTHYRSFNGLATIFYDGNETESSKFEAFTDQDIEKQSVAKQSLAKKHHGVAEPRGGYVLSTYLAPDSDLLSIVKSYELHGDHFHVDQTLKNPCNKLHGANSNTDYAAFGCEDGILVVEQKGNQFIDKKVLIDQRISAIAGHQKLAKFAGFASGTGDLFIIDPKNLNATSLNWAQGAKEADAKTPVKRLQHVFNTSGQFLVILDSTGTLHLIDTATWTVTTKLKVIENVVPEELLKSRLVANASTDTIFINDTHAKKILEIDLKALKVKQAIQLTDVPNTFTWVGVVNNSVNK